MAKEQPVVEDDTSDTTPEAAVETAGTRDNDQAKPSVLKRLGRWYKSHKKLAIPLTVVAVLGVLLGLPMSRYPLLGLVMRKDFKVQVVDSSTGQAVSSADVRVGGKLLKTDNQGQITARLKVGKAKLAVSKKYYKDLEGSGFVGLGAAKGPLKVQLEATGRQVPVKVTNKLNGAVLANATIKVAGSEFKTDAKGMVQVVVPADKDTQDGTLTADGFNEAKIKVQVKDATEIKNTFTATPSGKLYFLSKLSGKIDVVKTDLDGSNRQTVLAGTGKEEDRNTVLLASRDWKYLALYSKRDNSPTKLYLIETSNDKLTVIDEGDANFIIAGWVNHQFVYRANRNKLQGWEPKKEALKTYDADTKALATVNETEAVGDANNRALETIQWVQTVGDKVVFYKSWAAYHAFISNSFPELAGKQSRVMEFKPGDKNSVKTVKAYDLSQSTSTYTTYSEPAPSYNSVLYEPHELFFQVTLADAKNNKYENGVVTENDSEAVEHFKNPKSYATYLASPDGKATFWGESRDGKQALFIGDDKAEGAKQILVLGELRPYGWYTGDYLLASKNNSELYIVAKDGKSTPLKITDYHKPDTNFAGYGGGYGGN